MAKHTPGPWMWTHKEINFEMRKKGYHNPSRPWLVCLQSLADPFNAGISPEHPKWDGYAGVVLSVRLKSNRSGSLLPYKPPSPADARLIAAAPDLLAACKDMVDALDFTNTECQRVGSATPPDELCNEFLDNAKAAIAKAEQGESNG